MHFVMSHLDPWSDLMRAAMGGDGAAYARFLHEVTPVLRGVIRARGRHMTREQHEDLVQDVLLAIHKKRHTWQPDLPIRPWMFAIARHKVIDAFRAGGGDVHLPIEDFEQVLLADDAPDPFARRDVAWLIGQLDRRSARIVRAVALEEQPAATIGAELGLSDGAVRVALHRAMKRLSQLATGPKP